MLLIIITQIFYNSNTRYVSCIYNIWTDEYDNNVTRLQVKKYTRYLTIINDILIVRMKLYITNYCNLYGLMYQLRIVIYNINIYTVIWYV